MANQYITVENQTLLWKTIQRSPQFLHNTVHMNREQWFSNVIKYFYEQIKTPKLSIAELKEWNQKTIAYMITDLKRMETMYASSPNNSITPTVAPSSGVLANNGPLYETPQSRMSMYTNQFNARQQEYTNMVKPPAPPIANFSEKVEEEVITNMDELLQQQLKQREYDVAQVRPPPPVMAQDNTIARTPELGTSVGVRGLSGNNLLSQDNTRQDDVLHAIQELTKQLADLREEVRIIKERVPVSPSSDVLAISQDIEEHGVGV